MLSINQKNLNQKVKEEKDTFYTVPNKILFNSVFTENNLCKNIPNKKLKTVKKQYNEIQ